MSKRPCTFMAEEKPLRFCLTFGIFQGSQEQTLNWIGQAGRHFQLAGLYSWRQAGGKPLAEKGGVMGLGFWSTSER